MAKKVPHMPPNGRYQLRYMSERESVIKCINVQVADAYLFNLDDVSASYALIEIATAHLKKKRVVSWSITYYYFVGVADGLVTEKAEGILMPITITKE